MALAVLACGAEAADKASFDDTARVLAGMAPQAGSPLEPLTKDASWQSHAKYFDSAWKQLDERQLSKVRAWSAKNLPNRRATLFYMFSGPDFLYADAFFQGATTYVLSGLEPVGQVPDVAALPPRSVGQELRELQTSLNSVMSFSFFITKKMKTQLTSGRLTGTLPVLYTFLARSGKSIHDVTLVALKPDGTVTPVTGPAEKGTSPGVKIEFTSAGSSATQTLYYFNTDLSDSGIKTSGFLTFCEKLAPGDSFVKSASYLMHSDSFSKVREFLVAHSAAVVQDDSGIPVHFFQEAPGWQLHPFGAYLGPISIFPGRSQNKLREIFAKGAAQPIDFGIGYRYRPRESNLLLAVKADAAAAP